MSTQRNGKIFHAHILEESLKMSELPKANYRFSVIPANSPIALFTEIEQSPKISLESQKASNSQSSLEKE